MEPCEHEAACPGYGFAHEAGLSRSERYALGIALGRDLSRQRLNRIMRDARKRARAAADTPPLTKVRVHADE